MTYMDLTLFAIIILVFAAGMSYAIYVQRKLNQIDLAIRMRKELYSRLADPERIEREMEASARRREMYDANRTTLPRDDAGPPANVYRPKLRGQKPGSWRPRNPGSPSKK